MAGRTHRLPRGWWQSYCWYGSALCMTAAHHGFRGGHVSALVGAWFGFVSALYGLAFTLGALEQRYG